MSATAHTPGPWIKTGPHAHGYHIQAGPGVSNVAFNIPEEADADLIAAAPELAEALKVILSGCGEGSRDLMTKRGDAIDRLEQIEGYARAALKKAGRA